MKPTDADLIEALNALPEVKRAALLEFLGVGRNEEAREPGPSDRLALSAWLHHDSRKTAAN